MKMGGHNENLPTLFTAERRNAVKPKHRCNISVEQKGCRVIRYSACHHLIADLVYNLCDVNCLDMKSSVSSVSQWPSNSLASAYAMHVIQHSHVVNILPAYDRDNKLIPLERYRKDLAGAMVEIKFSLSHRIIPAGPERPGYDEYSANIINLRVLWNANMSIARSYKHFVFDYPIADGDTDDEEGAGKKLIGKKRKAERLGG